MSDADRVDPIEPLVEALLKELEEEPGREGLLKTPERVAESLRFLTGGYRQDPREILNDALFDISPHSHSCGDTQPSMSIFASRGVFNLFLNVLDRDEALEFKLLVHHRKLFNTMLMKNFSGFR